MKQKFIKKCRKIKIKKIQRKSERKKNKKTYLTVNFPCKLLSTTKSNGVSIIMTLLKFVNNQFLFLISKCFYFIGDATVESA